MVQFELMKIVIDLSGTESSSLNLTLQGPAFEVAGVLTAWAMWVSGPQSVGLLWGERILT